MLYVHLGKTGGLNKLSLLSLTNLSTLSLAIAFGDKAENIIGFVCELFAIVDPHE